MKAINTMTLTFDSLEANESFARSATAGFFTQLDPTVEELCDIRTAVSEAVTNAIVHGYRREKGRSSSPRGSIPGGRFRSPCGTAAAASPISKRRWSRFTPPTRKGNAPASASR